MPTLQQFLYVSRLSPNCELSDVVRAIASGRRNNPSCGISGVLYFDGEFFCQYLEGESDTLKPLLAKILADPRHYDLHVLLDRPLQARLFKAWHLGFAYQDTTGILRGLFALQGDAALVELMRIKNLPNFELL